MLLDREIAQSSLLGREISAMKHYVNRLEVGAAAW